jgi:hypothetical protein
MVIVGEGPSSVLLIHLLIPVSVTFKVRVDSSGPVLEDRLLSVLSAPPYRAPFPMKSFAPTRVLVVKTLTVRVHLVLQRL